MPAKILVVDDEPDMEQLMLQHFSKQIKNKTIELIFASSGMEALKKLDLHKDIDIMLTDINMREMDGLTLLSRVQKINRPIKSIIVSAYGDLENIRSAMRKGACDFITKPVDYDELEKTITSTLEDLHSSKTEGKASHTGSVEQDLDLDIARTIQTSGVPTNFKPFPENTNFEILGTVLSAREVGADFFDFFPIDQKKLAFTIADVTTKGISAALFMTMCRALIRVVGMQISSPKEYLEHLNRYLCEDNQRSMFLTMFYGILDTETGEISYCNAGHNPPYFVSKDGTIKQIGKNSGVALGVIETSKYYEGKIQLSKDESLVLYTDGLVKSINASQHEYSEQRLEELLRKSARVPPSKLLHNIIDDVKAFSAGIEQRDDITILCLQYCR